MNMELKLNSDVRFEIAMAKVIEGKEEQLFGQYFPSVGPIVAEFGAQPLGSFSVISAAGTNPVPGMGVFFSWPSGEAFQRFHNDPRFAELKPLRDDALELFSNGHFFQPDAQIVGLDGQSDYALIIANEQPLDADPLLDLPLADDSPAQAYIGKSVALYTWSDAAEVLLNAPGDGIEIYRIRFNPPAA